MTFSDVDILKTDLMLVHGSFWLMGVALLFTCLITFWMLLFRLLVRWLYLLLQIYRVRGLGSNVLVLGWNVGLNNCAVFYLNTLVGIMCYLQSGQRRTLISTAKTYSKKLWTLYGVDRFNEDSNQGKSSDLTSTEQVCLYETFWT